MNAPDPLVPPDLDVRDLDGFLLNVERLLASELVAVYPAEGCWAALMLWMRAWKQLPGGSLPNDERVLAAFSGAGKRWPKVREAALHGFVLCSDGRLYHRFLCQEAMRAYERKQQFRTRRNTERERIAEWRRKHRQNAGGTHDVTRTERVPSPNDTHVVGSDKGQGQGQGQGSKSLSDPNGSAPSNGAADPLKAFWDRGVRLLTDVRIPEKKARSLIGKWRSEYGEAAVSGAFALAEQELPSEPIGFIAACLANSKIAQKSKPIDQRDPRSIAGYVPPAF